MKIFFYLAGEEQNGINTFAKKVSCAIQKKSLATKILLVKEKKEFSDFDPDCDIAIFQFSKSLFGGYKNAKKEFQLIAELNGNILKKSIIILHDVYYRNKKDILYSLFSMDLERKKFINKIRVFKSLCIDYFYYDRIFKVFDRNNSFFIVNSNGELDRFLNYLPMLKNRTFLIPHFLSSRIERKCSNEKNRSYLLDKYSIPLDKKIITILGFIHKRKGHHYIPEISKSLGDEYHFIFAGAAKEPEKTQYLLPILDHAKKLSVDKRITVTGFLEDFEYDSILFSSDMALAPFSDISASGSISDWISVGNVPILASRNHLTIEFSKLIKIIHLVDFNNINDIVTSINEIFRINAVSVEPDVLSLLEERSLENTAKAYMKVIESIKLERTL
ncbi:hypothetical protein Q8W30_05650 [Neptunomonas phycophila]|uniref:Glycosyl transferase family 1 domain-containing protein n=1 Tax=Neptunomonas phycophila TaxID=1572645 RepID=A0ABT9ET13_9GAMM|nr:hypothetical protein [Neptunomonas phycophila]MDP2522052.1 hypothetical protein [Neptunomonas phycophila]